MRIALTALVLVLASLSHTPAKACGMRYMPSNQNRDVTILLAQGWRAEKSGDYEAALTSYRKATRMKRVSPHKRMKASLGVARMANELERPSLVGLYAQRALALDPGNPRAKRLLDRAQEEGAQSPVVIAKAPAQIADPITIAHK